MATYSSVTTFDFDGDGTPTSVPGTRTQEFDEHGNLVHDRSTIDLNGDSTPDFVDESRFTHDPNNVVTQVTERHGTENSGLAKLIAATDAVYTNAYNGQLTLLVDINADGAVDKHFTAQNTFDQNNRPVTVVEADNNGDGKIDYRAFVTNDYDALGKLVGEHQAIDRDANGAPDFLYTATHTYDPATGELIASEFHYDFNGDGTNDIETVVALTDQTTQTTGQTTQTTDQTTQTNKVVAVPDYFGLLDRNQDDKPGVTFSDFDNGAVGQDLGHPEGKGDGVIDSYDSKLPFDRTDLQALNDILSGGDPQKYANRYAIDDSGRDRRADLVNLKGLLEKYGDPDKPYPTHKEALTDQTTQTTDQTTQTTDQTTQTTDQTTQTTDQTTQTTDQHQTTQPTADSGKSSLPLAPFDGDHHNDIYTHDLALPGIHDTGDWFFT